MEKAKGDRYLSFAFFSNNLLATFAYISDRSQRSNEDDHPIMKGETL